jgi:membrane-associated protease RseP (regulator of RpoE activity)
MPSQPPLNSERLPPKSRQLPKLLLALLAALGSAGVAAMDALDAAILDALDRAEPGQPLRIERPARVHYGLGAVVDPQPIDAGAPHVRAITPGGAAVRMGLREGDRLLRINAVDLSNAQAPAEALRAAVQGGAGDLHIELLRNQQRLSLRGTADRITLPAFSLSAQALPEPIGVSAAQTPSTAPPDADNPTPTERIDMNAKHIAAALAAIALSTAASPALADGTCARVSSFDTAPRAQSLYRAVIISIDGRLPAGNDSSRIEPGRRVLQVAEAIDVDRFTDLELRARDGRHGERYKELVIDAQAGITYRVAARLKTGKDVSVINNTHWEPVVWRETAEPCR